MIKAVFFDWFNTLASYEPAREQLHSQALKEYGFEVSPDKVLPAVLEGDEYFFEENTNSPVAKRDPEEQAEILMRYQSIIVSKAGVKADRELVAKVMKKVGELFKGTRWILFDDALPILKELKQQNFIVGLLSNFDKDIGIGFIFNFFLLNI